MNTYLLLVLLKMTLLVSLLICFYRMVFQRLTFYKEIRLYFLTGMVLAAGLPFVQFQIQPTLAPEVAPQWIHDIPSISAIALPAREIGNTTIQTLFQPGNMIYIWIAGILFLMIRFGIRILSYLRLKRKSIPVSTMDATVYHLDDLQTPFSFGKNIFINTTAWGSKAYQQILHHEYIHVKERHSVDVLFAEVVTILNWYNPLAWMLKKAIRENLEFLTDDIMLQRGLDPKSYQYLLLQAAGPHRFSFAPAFNYHSLKSRIIMMNKNKSHSLHRIKFLLLLPVMLFLTLAFRSIQNEYPVTSIFDNNIVSPEPVFWPQDTVPKKDKNNKSHFSYNGFNEGKVTRIRIEDNKAEITLKDGTKENFDLNNEDDALEFADKYGDILPPVPPIPPMPPIPPFPPIPPVPPIPPIDHDGFVAPIPPIPPVPTIPPVPPIPPIPPIPPAPPMWDLPEDVTEFTIIDHKVRIEYKNGDVEIYNLEDSKQKEKFKEKYKLRKIDD